MSMSRRDFEAIAKAILHAPIHEWLWNGTMSDKVLMEEASEIRSKFSETMAVVLADTNPRFDRERFIAACTGR